MKAPQYAQALQNALRGKDADQTDAVLVAFATLLKESGHEKLFPRILREYEKLETRRARGAGVRVTVAHRGDAEAHAERITADLATLGAHGPEKPLIHIDQSVVGSYEVRSGGTSIDRTHKRALLSLYSHITNPLPTTNRQPMSTTIVEKLRKQLEAFEYEAHAEGVGVVVAVGDGVAEIDGLTGAMMAEMVEFDTTSGVELKEALGSATRLFGMVLNLEEHVVRAVVLGDTRGVREGMTVRQTGKVLSVPVGEALVGRVVNALGEPLDGKGPIAASAQYPVERPAHPVIERESVNTPLHTGIRAIDAMVPIGRGQRELIIGDRGTGKTVIAIDTILNQKHEPKETRPICIYVAIGQKESKTARIVAQLKDAGALEYTIVVDAPASDPAALQFLAPYAGVSMGEYFMEQGKDVLIIYDDLSKQSVAYREVSLLLRRPPGREAFPGDIFYLHSRLLERSAKLNKKLGGGSITALPIIETQEGDVSAYIPTNVISITDGQIYLETDLFNKGVRPAVNVGLSVSRVGSSAQTKAMKKVAGKMRLELAQFRELEAFAQFASDLDEDTKKRIDKGARLVEVLKQVQGKPVPFEHQVALILAANEGLFDAVSVERTAQAAEAYRAYLVREKEGVLEIIRTERDLSDAAKAELVSAQTRFSEVHTEFFR